MHRKFDPKVFQLGYVALQTAEFARTKDHYVGTLGMTQTGTGDDDAAYLSLGYNSHDIVLKPADGKALLHLGYHLKPEIELKDFATDVERLGLAAQIKSDSQPGIARLVEVEGPGGNIFQFYSQMAAPAPGFAKSGVLPLRLGHVAVISQDAEKLMKFYEDFLGFWFTDDIAGIREFLHLQPRPSRRQHRQCASVEGPSHCLPAEGQCPPCDGRRRPAGKRRQHAVGAEPSHRRTQHRGLPP